MPLTGIGVTVRSETLGVKNELIVVLYLCVVIVCQVCDKMNNDHYA